MGPYFTCAARAAKCSAFSRKIFRRTPSGNPSPCVGCAGVLHFVVAGEEAPVAVVHRQQPRAAAASSRVVKDEVGGVEDPVLVPGQELPNAPRGRLGRSNGSRAAVSTAKLG